MSWVWRLAARRSLLILLSALSFAIPTLLEAQVRVRGY